MAIILMMAMMADMAIILMMTHLHCAFTSCTLRASTTVRLHFKDSGCLRAKFLRFPCCHGHVAMMALGIAWLHGSPAQTSGVATQWSLVRHSCCRAASWPTQRAAAWTGLLRTPRWSRSCLDTTMRHHCCLELKPPLSLQAAVQVRDS